MIWFILGIILGMVWMICLYLLHVTSLRRYKNPPLEVLNKFIHKPEKGDVIEEKEVPPFYKEEETAKEVLEESNPWDV